ncbi:MAG: hypothetical protein J7L88_05835 [Thermoplasmata archaeon]|nr:hypothetical protein [Thermoplasmata archaeon]
MPKEEAQEDSLDDLQQLLNKLQEAEKEIEEIDVKLESVSRKADDASVKVEEIISKDANVLESYPDSALDAVVEEPYIEVMVEEGVPEEIKELAQRLLDFADLKIEKGAVEDALDFLKIVEQLDVKDVDVQNRLSEIKNRLLKKELSEEGGVATEVIAEGDLAGEILDLKKKAEAKLQATERLLKGEKEVDNALTEKLERAKRAYTEGRYFRAMRLCDEINSALKKKLEYTLEMRTHTLLDRVQDYLDALEKEPEIFEEEKLTDFRNRMNTAVKHFLTQNLATAYNIGQRLLSEIKSLYLNRKTQNITRDLMHIKSEIDELNRYPELEGAVRELKERMDVIRQELSKGTREGIENAENHLSLLRDDLERVKSRRERIAKTQEFIRKITLKLVGVEDEEERRKFSSYLGSIKKELKEGREDIALEAAEKLYGSVSKYVESRMKGSVERPYQEAMNLLNIFEALFPEDQKRYAGLKEELVMLYSEGDMLKLKDRLDEVMRGLSEELPGRVKKKLSDILNTTVDVRVGLWEVKGAGSPLEIDLKKSLKLLKKVEEKPLDSSMDLAKYYGDMRKALNKATKAAKELKSLFKEISRGYFRSIYSLAPRWIKLPLYLYAVEIVLPRAVELYNREEYFLSYLLMRRLEGVMAIHSERGMERREEGGEDLKMLKEIIPVGGIKEKFLRDMVERAEMALEARQTLLLAYIKGAVEAIIKS